MRLDVSAVQHDMKREETVEDVEKNTEWQRRTPKRGAGGSNPLWDARKRRCKPFFGVCSVFVPPSPGNFTSVTGRFLYAA